MRKLTLLLFLVFNFAAIVSFAQDDCDEDYNEVANSVEKLKYKEVVFEVFQNAFDTEEDRLFLLEAQKTGFRLKFLPVDSDLDKRLDEFMSMTSCNDCSLYLETKTNDPIKMIYDSIKCKDVFQISRLKDEFYLKLFRISEEE